MRGIAFGIFDGLHEGHRRFLADAAGRCDELVIVVAPDAAALALKSRAPRRSLAERLAAVAAFLPGARIVIGDDAAGSWTVLERESPDIAIVGYDQDALADALSARGIRLVRLSAHEPGRFKSSLIDRDKKPSRRMQNTADAG